MDRIRHHRSRLVHVVALAAGLTVGSTSTALAGSGSWRSLAPIPAQGIGVEGPSVAALQTGEIVAAYGFDGADTRRTRIYDIGEDEWELGAPGPLPHRSEGSAVGRGPFLYAVGGRGLGVVLADLDRYNVLNDSWASLADMPTPRAGLATAIIGHEIYAIGGRTEIGGPCSGGEVSAVERYDIRTDSWVTLAPLPSARSDVAAVAVNGRIYVFGGCRFDKQANLVILRKVDVYSPATDTWSKAPRNLPEARSSFYQVGVAQRWQPEPKVFVIGGWDGVGTGESSVFIFNVTTNSYTSGEPMPTPRAEMGVASFRGRIFAVGGAQPGFGASVDAVEVYRP